VEFGGRVRKRQNMWIGYEREREGVREVEEEGGRHH